MSEPIMILGSLQAHASIQMIDNQGGGICPTIGTTDFGLPKIVENMGVNDEITTEVIGMIDNNRLQDHARRIHGIEGVAPTQNAHSGGGLETKIAEPVENTDGKKVSIISRPHGYYKGSEYEDICPCVKSSAMADNNYVKEITNTEPFVAASRGREPQCLTPKRTEHGKAVRKAYESGQHKESRHTMQQLEPRADGVTNTLTSVQKDNLVVEPVLRVRQATAKGYAEVKPGGAFDARYPKSNTRRGRVQGEGGSISPTLQHNSEICAMDAQRGESGFRIRRLTPRECFRLMGCDEPTIDKLLNAGISNTQLYKLAGNSIVIDVLYHIFRKMFVDKENENQQLTLF